MRVLEQVGSAHPTVQATVDVFVETAAAAGLADFAQCELRNFLLRRSDGEQTRKQK